MALVTTLPEELWPLMEGCSVETPYCAVCGRTSPLNRHHVVRRGAGQLVRHGVAMPKPTIMLCGSGNAGGCHGLAHANRLHFRWVVDRIPCYDAGTSFNLPCTVTVDGGHWEYRLFPEPVKYSTALKAPGWRPLAGAGKAEW